VDHLTTCRPGGNVTQASLQTQAARQALGHDMTALVESFGIAVRQLREAQGWSQEGLAERSDLNRSYVGEIERGSVIASMVTVARSWPPRWASHPRC
jgi:ribosome-binding protein aMBF1 (putative translation factor)